MAVQSRTVWPTSLMIVPLLLLPAFSCGVSAAHAAVADHFECYSADDDDGGDDHWRGGFGPQVSLVDQFGAMTAVVGQPDSLCNPASKNGGDPTAPSHVDHLESYRILPLNPRQLARRFPVLQQKVVNEFGTLMVDVQSPLGLLVPTTTKRTKGPAAPASPAVDHFTCYDVQPSAKTPPFASIRNVKLTDEFGTATVTVVKPSRLCVSTNMNGKAPGAETHLDQLMCYRLKADFNRVGRVFTNNEFGPGTFVPVDRDEFCVPSRLNQDRCRSNADCSDANQCTTDVCDASSSAADLRGCVHSPIVCAAADQCHIAGTCNPSTGACSNPAAPNGTACTDGNACTQIDTCQSGACVGSNPVTCAPTDQCHVAGSCNPATGACSNPAAPNGTACSDSNACTRLDTCQAGVCAGSNPVTCAPADQCHVAGSCDPATGACSNPAAPNGTLCSDGNACTRLDACQAGACIGSSPVVCTATDACHIAGACDPANGTCSNPPAPDGTTCSDGTACTRTDSCRAGACVGSNPVVCTATDQCHVAGTCDSSTGTCSNPAAPDGTTCTDGNGCTPTDACHTGICIGAGSLNCDDGDACTTDSCDSTTGGCRHDPAGCGGATFGISVIDAQGLPIVGAQVTVGSTTQLTDSAGNVLFADVPPGGSVAMVQAAGFAPSTLVADLVANMTVEGIDRLLSRGLGITFDAGIGVMGANDGVRVSIPPNAVVDANGQPVSGNVQLTIVPLDPSTSKVDFAPGPFTGQPAAGGGLVPFESLFMAEISLQDGSGNPLQLAPAATAELAFRVPSNLVSSVSVGDQVPAWFYDAPAGLWREEGAGTIQVTGSSIEWVVTVGHLSWWSADRPWTDTNCVRVTVTQPDGATPIAGATVRATGLSYSGTTTSETGADGSACLELERGAQVMITVEHPSFPVHLDDPFIIQGDASAATTCSDLPTGCQQIALRLDGKACFNGTVVDPSGQPMAGAQVYASFNDASGNQTGYTAQTGIDGSFCVDAPSNSCIEVFAFAMDGGGPLRAQSGGCGTAASDPTCGPGGQCSDLGLLQLARSATRACVKGRVVTPQGAAGGTTVSIYSDQPDVTCSNPPAPTDDPGYWGSLVGQSTTDANGSFCVDIPVAPTNSDPTPFSLPRAILPADCQIRRRNSNNRGAVTLYLDPFAADATCADSPDCLDIGTYHVFFLQGS